MLIYFKLTKICFSNLDIYLLLMRELLMKNKAFLIIIERKIHRNPYYLCVHSSQLYATSFICSGNSTNK